ncbi:hypothetical protein MCP_1053 [Methanocella paludicola SANAE]|uniref:Uncharacterized protein n=2 Tax=Methanocella TaxID=570266 RepID=D1YXF3_METPS|nr:hypothetical protein MCP_1053 [Methanocella paludicola SANAE]
MMVMAEKCFCGLNPADIARGEPYKDPGFRKVKCAKCGLELLTDIKDKTCCFECEKSG